MPKFFVNPRVTRRLQNPVLVTATDEQAAMEKAQMIVEGWQGVEMVEIDISDVTPAPEDATWKR